MKIVISYSSKFGNGKKCVEELKDILEKSDNDVEIFSISQTDPDTLPEADLYIFSSPVRKFMLPRETKVFLKGFKPKKEDAKYALMTTHGLAKPMAFKRMDRILGKKTLDKVTDGFAAKVLGTEGPLEDAYRKKLEDFAEEISDL